MNTLILLAALHGVTLGSAELELMPVVTQDVVLFLSDEVTAGGAGGALGAQLTVNRFMLAQLDVGALWGFGNALSTRLAIGMQREGAWAPAAWLTMGAIWGERVEFLQGDGRRPSLPSWSVGVRGAPLRFSNELGVFSALEPGIGTDFDSGLWIELKIVQVGLRL